MSVSIDPSNVSLLALLGGFVGLKIINECINEVFGAIRKVISPKKEESLSAQTHELCLQQRQMTDRTVLDEITKLHNEIAGIKRLLVITLEKDGRVIKQEELEYLGVFK